LTQVQFGAKLRSYVQCFGNQKKALYEITLGFAKGAIIGGGQVFWKVGMACAACEANWDTWYNATGASVKINRNQIDQLATGVHRCVLSFAHHGRTMPISFRCLHGQQVT
jgi:hypothetical protein